MSGITAPFRQSIADFQTRFITIAIIAVRPSSRFRDRSHPFVRRFFGDEDFFPGDGKYTLEPLLTRSEGVLACGDVPGREQVQLRRQFILADVYTGKEVGYVAPAWQALEVLLGPAAVLAEWRRLAGPDLDLLVPYLQRLPRLAASYPRLAGGEPTYPYEVVEHGPNDFAGICLETEDR